MPLRKLNAGDRDFGVGMDRDGPVFAHAAERDTRCQIDRRRDRPWCRFALPRDALVGSRTIAITGMRR